MSNIEEYLEEIRLARYGKDVRQAIYNAIMQCYEDGKTGAVDLTARSGIVSLREDITEMQGDIAALDSKIETTGIAKSTDYTLRNSKAGGYRLNELVGNTEQKTLSGKNLLSVNQFSSDGLGNALRYTPIELKTGVKYKICLTTSATSGNCEIWFGDENKVDIEKKALSLVNFNNGGELEYTPTQDIYYVRFFQNAGCSYSDVMISVEGGEYEPYCGGPSPNPSFPQAIENTFDCVEMIQGAWAQSTGGVISGNKYICSKHIIPCKGGEVVTLKCDNVEKYRLIYFNESGMTSTSSEIIIGESGVIPNDGTTHFAFNLMHSAEITPQTVGKITLTVNGKYVGQIVECGKNFAKTNNVSGTGYVTISDFMPKGTYTMSCKVTSADTDNSKSRVVFKGVYGNDVTCDFTRNDRVSKKIVLTEDIKSIVYYSSLSASLSSGDTFTFADIQIEKGEVATEYEPYTEKVTTFFLNEPLRALDRIVKVDGVFKVERICREIVLNGTEKTWDIQDTTLEDCINPYVGISGAEKNSQRNYIKSTHFVSGNAGSNNPKKGTIILNSLGINMLFQVPKTIATTLDEWKTWLTSNNVVVQIKRAEPIYETLDAESQIALNSPETFDTITYLEVDSKVKPTSISGEYGTSQVGAYTLKCMNDNDTDRIERAEMKARLDELAVALVSQ